MALTKITSGVIKANENYDTHNINSTGIVTAVSANFTGNVSIGGTLTYQDVTNIDSVGVVTARAGVNISGGNLQVGGTNVINSGRVLYNLEELKLADTKELVLGSGNDLKIHHSGSHSFISQEGVGALKIKGNDIRFENASATERLRITSDGYLGINHSSPGTRLVVKQNNGVAYNGNAQTSSSNAAVFLNQSGHTNGGTYTGFQFNITGDSQNRVSSIGAITESSSNRNSSLVFHTDDNGNRKEKLRITSSGSIGIGTVNPGSKLTVYETGGNAKLQLQRANTANNTDDYGSILWRSMGGTAVGAINLARASAENDGYMFFQTTSGGTMSERMRIQPSGYIGIGEVAPGGRLTVKHANTSTSGLNATLKLKQGVATNGNRSSLIFSSLDDFDVAAVNGVVDTHSGTAANNVGHLEFWTKESGNATAQERVRVHPTGQVSINSNGWMGRFHIQQDAITEPAFSIRHHDASLYKHMGTVGPNDRNGTDASNGGQYLHVRVRTVWNDSSMTMFRITGYYPYSDYTHSFVGMYRYGHSSYRTNPYGQTVHNLKRATIHSVYNEAASPGYLVFVCDWNNNYTGLLFEHIGAGSVYGSYMQNDIEIIDSLRSTGTSALTF